MAVKVSKTLITVHDPDGGLGSNRDALDLAVRHDVSNNGFRTVTPVQFRSLRDCAFRDPSGNLVRLAQA